MKRMCTASENVKLLDLYQQLGKKWKLISSQFPNKSRAAIRARFYSLLRKIFRKISIACRMFPESKFIRRIELKTLDKLLTLPIQEAPGLALPPLLPSCLNLNTYFDVVKQVVKNESQFLQCCRLDDGFRDFMKSSISSLLNFSNINTQHSVGKSESSKFNGDESDFSQSCLSKSQKCPKSQVEVDPQTMHPLMQAFCVNSASFSLNLSQESTANLDKSSLLDMLHSQITMCNDLLMLIHHQQDKPLNAIINNNNGTEIPHNSKMNVSLENKDFSDQRSSSEIKSFIADNKSESISRLSKSLSLNESRVDGRLSTSSQNECRNGDEKVQTNFAETLARTNQVSSHSEALLWNNNLRGLGDSEHFNASFIIDNDLKGTTHDIDWSFRP